MASFNQIIAYNDKVGGYTPAAEGEGRGVRENILAKSKAYGHVD